MAFLGNIKTHYYGTGVPQELSAEIMTFWRSLKHHFKKGYNKQDAALSLIFFGKNLSIV